MSYVTGGYGAFVRHSVGPRIIYILLLIAQQFILPSAARLRKIICQTVGYVRHISKILIY